MNKRAIDFDEMLDVYFDSESMPEKCREAWSQCILEDTFRSFSLKFSQILNKQSVIKELFMKCSPNDKTKFRFDLWIKKYSNSKLKSIVDLNYNPDLYRDYFLHPFLFIEEDLQESLSQCGRLEHLEIDIDENEYEWVMGDQTYVEELCEILGEQMDITKEMRIPIVEYRRLIVEEIGRSSGIMVFCIIFGKTLKKAIENVFALTEEELLNISKKIEGLSEEESTEEIENSMFLGNVIKRIKNETQEGKSKENDTGFGLCNQKMVDIVIARDFWYVFLLNQSKLEFMRKSSEEEKVNHVFSEELLQKRDSLKEAYECVHTLKTVKEEDFVVSKKYLQHVLEGMNVKNIESCLRYPIWWLLGNKYKNEGKITIDFPREVYYRHMTGKKVNEDSRARNDHHAYDMNNLRKKIVHKFDDEAWLYDMVIMLQPMTIKEQVTFIYAMLGKDRASEFYDVYIWLQQITTYLLLIYDEETFISRYNYFCEMLMEIVVTLQDLRRTAISNKNL